MLATDHLIPEVDAIAFMARVFARAMLVAIDTMAKLRFSQFTVATEEPAPIVQLKYMVV